MRAQTDQTARFEWTKASHQLLLVCGCAALFFVSFYHYLNSWSAYPSGDPAEDQIDIALQRAATDALGDAEGTIIVMDPRNGRVRAIVNPEIAFGQSFAPGSTIKPFTALAAMRAGVLDTHSRVLCREHYSKEDFRTTCSHPVDLPGFDTEQALAYSCNYYFGRLGEKVSEDSFRATLASFGFGRSTGANRGQESAGKLSGGKWTSKAALGEGAYTQVTPAQLINAYAALANGGQLLTPQVEESANFKPRLIGKALIDAEQRDVILAGMRGAVRFGTAEKSGLSSLSREIFGKTGTSTPLKGFRTQGWFVGFEGQRASGGGSPQTFNLVVLVFLKRSHGSDAAALSRPIFEEFARLDQPIIKIWKAGDGKGDRATRSSGETDISLPEVATPATHQPVSQSPSQDVASPPVRVHLVRENLTVELPLEDYVVQVVATEGSTEDEPEALKALAIAVRTYALKNRARHESEGFDFCSTTHCQRFQMADYDAAPANRIVDAVRSTTGEVLIDHQRNVAESYFGASCGGATANLGTLWGGPAPEHLRGVPDDYCTAMPHHTWTDVISRSQLLTALHSDARTDVGARLDQITVSRRDKTDRAELITLLGEKRKVIRGWDFKLIVGRSLGWNKLKSSRFTVRRAGNDFVFHGSGFGHGLGLCQEGAHVMAQRGASYRQILTKYFPGTTSRGGASWPQPASRSNISRLLTNAECEYRPGRSPTIREGSYFRVLGALPNGRASAKKTKHDYAQGWHADVLLTQRSSQRPLRASLNSSRQRLNLSSEHFRVSFSALHDRRDVELVLNILDNTRASLLRRTANASISTGGMPAINVNINDTTGDFVGRTGQPWWAAAASRGNQIELQPLAVLNRRGVLTTTLRHELAHAFIDAASHGRAPRWLAEGFALHLAGEGRLISRYAGKEKLAIADLEKRLSQPGSAEEMRALYAAAYREVSAIIKSQGESQVWRQVATY